MVYSCSQDANQENIETLVQCNVQNAEIIITNQLARLHANFVSCFV